MLAELDDCDWAEAFADKSSGNTTKDVEAHGVSDEPFTREDVAEILAMVTETESNNPSLSCAETNCYGLFRLKDGRYLAVEASCDTTGWDCQAGNTLTVAGSLGEVVRYGVTDAMREAVAQKIEQDFPDWDSRKVLADYLESQGDWRCELLMRRAD